MNDATADATPYQPEAAIEMPPFFAWPPQPVGALRWLFFEYLFPWGFLWIAASFVLWFYFTPDLARMATLEAEWIALLWLRNATMLVLVAGGLHWWLHSRRSQGKAYKFEQRWLAKDNGRYLFRDQVKDNMFWSLASGCTIWTLYEAFTYWLYANEYVAVVSWSDAPVYLTLMILVVFAWSSLHFYLNHRLLHWPPLFRMAHALHHRNINIGPWTGISMHPLEHLIYFSVFALWWVVPVHPVIIVLCGLFQGVGPAPSHSGFDFLRLGSKRKLSVGDQFHTLHHQHFEVNYGNLSVPLDKWAGSWHDGTPQATEAMRQKRRLRTTQETTA